MKVYFNYFLRSQSATLKPHIQRYFSGKMICLFWWKFCLSIDRRKTSEEAHQAYVKAKNELEEMEISPSGNTDPKSGEINPCGNTEVEK